MTNDNSLNLDSMSVHDFQERLPDLFASAGNARISEDPRFSRFLAANPTCAELVRDLEYIAETARQLIDITAEVEPSDAIWSNIQSKLKSTGDVDEPS